MLPGKPSLRGVHLGSLTDVLARRHPDRPAVTDPAPTPGVHLGGTRTYDELETAVGLLASAHRSSGRVAGETVLVAVDNRIDTLLHAVALARLGCVPALCNPRLTPTEAAAVARATGADAVVGDADVLARLALDDDTVTTDDLAAWLGTDVATPVPPRSDADPDAVALLLTTSGTTGEPKAAALTSSGLLGVGALLGTLPLGHRSGPRGGRDRVLAALPLAHVMGLGVLLVSLCAGLEHLHAARFDADAVLDRVEADRPNVLVGVPTMYADLEAAGADGRDLSSVQLFVSAADAMPDARARRFQRRGAVLRVAGRTVLPAAFVDVYGMVELSGAAAYRLFPPLPGALPALGVASPALSMRTVDDAGDPVGWGEVGELQVRGGGVLEEYRGRPDAGPGDDGWFATGDRVRRFPGGLLQFAGRDADRLKVGGFSVFPAEVEQELLGLGGIAEVVLVGLPDERLGDRPVALVVPTADGLDPQAFLAQAATAVAGYRRPRGVVVVDAVPRGNNGKVDRTAATALAVEAAGAGRVVGAA